MIAYKIVRPDLTSYVVEEAAKVQYVEGEFVEAPAWLARLGYHLCVYDDQGWAKRCFLSGSGDRSVWEVECEDEVELPKIGALDWLRKGHIRWIDATGWPYHTRMFKRVKLLRRIA